MKLNVDFTVVPTPGGTGATITFLSNAQPPEGNVINTFYAS